MKKQLMLVRIFLVAMTLISAITAGTLSTNTSYGSFQPPINDFNNQTYETRRIPQSPLPVDGAADGGAAGFAIMSGLSLVALSITFLRKED